MEWSTINTNVLTCIQMYSNTDIYKTAEELLAARRKAVSFIDLENICITILMIRVETL